MVSPIMAKSKKPLEAVSLYYMIPAFFSVENAPFF